MFDIGMSELVVIFVVALLVFGPKRLPELARALGKGLAEIKRSLNDAKKQVQTEFREIESQEQGGGVTKGFADLKRSLDDVRKQVEAGYKQVMEPVGHTPATPAPKPDENAIEEEEEELEEVEKEQELDKEKVKEKKIEKKEEEGIESQEKMEKKEETEQKEQEEKKA